MRLAPKQRQGSAPERRAARSAGRARAPHSGTSRIRASAATTGGRTARGSSCPVSSACTCSSTCSVASGNPSAAASAATSAPRVVPRALAQRRQELWPRFGRRLAAGVGGAGGDLLGRDVRARVRGQVGGYHRRERLAIGLAGNDDRLRWVGPLTSLPGGDELGEAAPRRSSLAPRLATGPWHGRRSHPRCPG